MSENFQLTDDVLTFSEEIGVTHAAELYEALNEYLESGGAKLSIDASAIKKVDGAVLQLVAALVTEIVDEQHGEVDWVKPSDYFTRAAEMLDLNGHMRLH